MKQPITFSLASCVLQPDLVFPDLPAAQRRTAFSTSTLVHHRRFVLPAVGRFFWTAMLLRLFFMTSRFGIQKHFCGLGSFVRQPRRMAIAKRPGDPDLLYYLAQAHDRLAKQVFEQLRQSSPGSPQPTRR
jgi:hypothetical protein